MGVRFMDLPAFDPKNMRLKSRFFAMLDDQCIQKLMDRGSQKQYSAGTAIVTKGEASDSFFMLLDGVASVHVDDTEQPEAVDCLTRGSLFGELSTILAEPRPATVIAQTASTLLRFDGQAVQEILTDYPEVREQLVKIGIKRSEANLDGMINNDFSDMPVTIAEIDDDSL